eukprot:TRINITY_DN61542_c0_g1_i1.p1 TRINITY_DN61542_c0_g1~~TRINITY_DN61542_c0_g1_i1.p1  ORF type:complete len:180 (+),score=30.84 TRINITY_DN61542_c0_g1_i1:80-541(+)
MTRQSSGYNPLDTSGHEKNLAKPGADTWVCVAAGSAFREAPRKDAAIVQESLKQPGETDGTVMTECPVGAELFATREGDWLKLDKTGHFVCVKDAEKRYFKNKRLILWEDSQAAGDGPTRRPSTYSNSSADNPQKKKSSGSNDGGKDSSCAVM